MLSIATGATNCQNLKKHVDLYLGLEKNIIYIYIMLLITSLLLGLLVTNNLINCPSNATMTIFLKQLYFTYFKIIYLVLAVNHII